MFNGSSHVVPWLLLLFLVCIPKYGVHIGLSCMYPHRTEEFSGSELGFWGQINQDGPRLQHCLRLGFAQNRP